MSISFENQVALVTGAACGLGLATANAFAASGVQSAAGKLADKGHKTLAIRCDVSDDPQVEAMVKQAVAAFGRLHAFYNNAGVQISSRKPLTPPARTTIASWASTCVGSGTA
jgi:NAD(P)-dependent dehydrogenase (short-subunit alcohol dehydrogenase family)